MTVYRKNNIVYLGNKRLGVVYPSKKTFTTFRSITRHLFRAYNGWGINAELLDYLEGIGIVWIEVRDSKENKLYRTNIKTIRAKGLSHYYGDEEQKVLPLQYWDTYEIPRNGGEPRRTKRLTDYMGV